MWKLPETRKASQGPTVGRHGGLMQLGNVARHLTEGRFAMILAAIFVTTFAFAQFESTLSLLTREFGYSSKRNFLLFAYIGAILMIGQGVLVRRFLPRVGEFRMALLGVLMMTVGFILLALTGQGILPPSALVCSADHHHRLFSGDTIADPSAVSGCERRRTGSRAGNRAESVVAGQNCRSVCGDSDAGDFTCDSICCCRLTDASQQSDRRCFKTTIR
ncbi:MAG: hypothetical protein R3C49_17565 [Planctomycetaceae bacterium]